MQYGCIGEHLSHSFSKEIHAALADYDYILKEIPQDALCDFMTAHDFCGINVTIPYKQAVIPFLAEIQDAAKAIGAVNTIVNRDGRLCGYNTDFGGMEALIHRSGIVMRGAKVLVLGTGGTSKTATAVAAHMGAAAVYTVSRSGKNGALTYEQALSAHADADVLINATPCGMFGNSAGDMPIDPKAFQKLSGVVDAIYHPLRTPLVLQARRAGATAVGGLYMLVMQAVLASEIFTGQRYSRETVEAVYRKIRLQKENIVLTGMPASGKTTVGRLLAEKLGRPFIDTDAEIVKAAGVDIPTIFKERGEAAFRDLETQVIKKAGAETGVVIATGGGAVLREENVDALRQNGQLVFLNRPLEQLVPTDDRPLAASKEAIFKRYSERFPTYILTADIAIPAGDTPAEVAALAERRFCDADLSD